MNEINIITLGCSKNTVDSEMIATQLENANIKFVFDQFDTSVKTVVINTCGFIADAKEESIDTILDFAQAKKDKEIENLYVIGCLSERYKDELKREFDNVDEIFGVNNIKEIVETLKADYKKELIGERVISTPKHYAYLKVSEGCDRTCSFCAIPLIRGKHVSVPQEILLSQAKNLASKGVKELILIAQDISYYGLDLYKRQALPELLEKLANVEGLKRIRIHYAYPANFPFEVLDVMKKHSNICRYIDIPFQHISDNVLKKMRRGHSKKTIIKFIKRFRKEIPEIVIRTTILIGHPGETDEDFNELKDFVEEMKFDRLGVFTYSEEEDTYGGNNYKDDVPKKTKNKRANEIMTMQQEISYNLNLAKIDKIFEVIIDKEDEEFYFGRTEFDSPEVDNEVLINKDKELKVGELYNIRITNAVDFDLYGELVL